MIPKLHFSRMKLTRLLVAIFVLSTSNLFGQNLLSDSTFLAFFEAKTISLKELKIKRNPTWMLVAGVATKEQIAYTEEEDMAFRLYADSIEGQKADLYTYDKEICDSRCKITKFECLKRTLNGKGDADACDSIFELCEDRCTEIKESRDKMLDDSLEIIWNNHEFRYSYNIQSSFSNSKKGIPFRNHADSLILCYAKGFAPYCSPSGFSWFLLTKHRKKITTIDSKEKLLALLGNIDSYPKAYLMLCAAGYTTPYTYPQANVQLMAKQAGEVFYFIVRQRLPECLEDEYTYLVRINSNGKATLVEQKLNFKQ